MSERGVCGPNAGLLVDLLFELLYVAPTPPCQLKRTCYVGCVGHIMKMTAGTTDNELKIVKPVYAFFLGNDHAL